MDNIGIRQLKRQLSAYIDRVKQGEAMVITDRGKEVAMLTPVSPERERARELIAMGEADWEGGKPRGLRNVKAKGAPVSETLLRDRR